MSTPVVIPEIVTVDECVEVRATQLPELVAQFIAMKHTNAAKFMASIDYDQLPPDYKLRVLQLDQSVRGIVRSITQLIENYDEDLQELQEDIRSLNLKSRDGGLVEFTGEKSEEDEV